MKILIIGGSGTISTYVVRKCVEMKMDVTILNRGIHHVDLPKSVKIIIGDIKDKQVMMKLMKDYFYDSVIEFVAFTKEDVQRDIEVFKGKTRQYIFISSASAYHKPVEDYPMTEETPLKNPYWSYSQDKIECEEYLKTVIDMNITIVRPSHTYDNKMIMAVMTRWGYEYAHIQRLKDGLPIIIPGDGTSVWTITHAKDFANSFVYLIGNEAAYNDVFHITGEKLYTWDQFTQMMAQALGVKAHIIHIPTDFIIQMMPEMEGPLFGDKSWSAIFDNSKIKKISQEYTSNIGYEDVVMDVIKYYESQPEKQKISEEYEELYDLTIELYQKNLRS